MDDCYVSCLNDSDCKGIEKCCNVGCNYECMIPIYTGEQKPYKCFHVHVHTVSKIISYMYIDLYYLGVCMLIRK